MANTVRPDRSRSPNVSAPEQTAPWMTAAAVMGADANRSWRGDDATRTHLGHIHQSLDQVYPPWTTGQVHCDEWVRNNVRDATCFAALASISVPSRLHIVRGAMNKVQLADPDSWLHVCVRNHLSKYTGKGKPNISLPATTAGSPCSVSSRPSPLTVSGVSPQPRRDLSVELYSMPTPLSGKSTAPNAVQPPAVMPDWVRCAYAESAASRPSRLLVVVLEQFTPEERRIMQMETPQMQLHLAMSALLSTHAWAHPGAHVMQLVHTLAQLRNPPVLQSPIGPAKAVTRLSIVMIHNFCGVGTGHLVIKAGVEMLKNLRPDIEICVQEIYSFEVDADACLVNEAVAKACGFACVSMGDVSNLPELVRINAQRWAQNNWHVLVFNSLPSPTPPIQGIGHQRAVGSQLHLPDSRSMWHVCKGLQQLAGLTGNDRVAHMTEIRTGMHEQDDRVLDFYWGKSFICSPRRYGAATRMRQVRSGPQQLDLAHFGAIIDHAAESLDGWKWKGNCDQHGTVSESAFPNITLSGDIPDILERCVFGQPLHDSERATLNCMRMIHASKQEEQFVSRSFWMLWLGMRGTPIEKTLLDLWPCHGCIIASTGEAAGGHGQGEPCGRSRYCRHCEKVMKLVGESGHLGIMTDCAIAVLQKCVVVWTLGNGAVPWHAFPVGAEIHRCGPSCQYNTCSGK